MAMKKTKVGKVFKTGKTLKSKQKKRVAKANKKKKIKEKRKVKRNAPKDEKMDMGDDPAMSATDAAQVAKIIETSETAFLPNSCIPAPRLVAAAEAGPRKSAAAPVKGVRLNVNKKKK